MNTTSNKPRALALQLLNKIFLEGAYANIALAQALADVTLNDQDRRFLTELVYGTVKAKGTLDWLIEKVANKGMKKIDGRVLNALRLGAYQLFYLDKVPASAACNETVELVKHFGHTGMVNFTNGIMRTLARDKDQLTFPARTDNEPLWVALTYQHPLWLVERWHYRYGMENAIKICEFDNKQPKFSFRVNTLKTSRNGLQAKMQEAGYEVTPSQWSKEGLLGTKIGSTAELMKKFGKLIYIQDESSMLVADILNPQPGETVIDLCSAPGGKTTHLAQKMANQGKIIASDIHQHKLELIKSNVKRLGVNIVETYLQDATQQVAEWVGKADRVLVDAPCSGLGVLGRRPEARWTKEEKKLSQFPPLQKKILANAATYVKQGGYLVYSTCTLEQDENTRVVAAFLQEHPEFGKVGFKHPLTGETVEELQLLPQQDDVDGFYICLMQKR